MINHLTIQQANAMKEGDCVELKCYFRKRELEITNLIFAPNTAWVVVMSEPMPPGYITL